MRMQSAKSTSESVDVLKSRLQQGIAVYSYMYVEALRRFLKQENRRAVKQVHEFIIESGMQQNSYVANNLRSAYIRCGRLEGACSVFDDLVKKNVTGWTIMIGGHAQHSHAKDAMEAFNQILQEGVQPDAVTCLSILKACESPSALEWGKDVHARIGSESDARVGTALLKMYAKCGSRQEARKCFGRMENRDVIAWTVMIGGYAETGCGEEASGLFVQLVREGFKPNAITYASILNACASARALECVKVVHGHARDGGFESDVRVGNALVHMYAKCGSIDDARLVFDRMENRDIIMWTVMIGGLGQHGWDMKSVGVKPDAYSFVAVVSACSRSGLVDEGRRLFLAMSQDSGIVPSVVHRNCMVDILGRAGQLDEAKLIIDDMQS